MQKQNKRKQPHHGDRLGPAAGRRNNERPPEVTVMCGHPPQKRVKIHNQVAEVKTLTLDMRRRGTREQQEGKFVGRKLAVGRLFSSRSRRWRRVECGTAGSLHRWVVHVCGGSEGGVIDGVEEMEFLPRARQEASLPLTLHHFCVSYRKKRGERKEKRP